jgi:putative ABC transport system ATP-binding protein
MTILRINDVFLQFAGSNRPALQKINYQIHQGDFVILLGSNGSGKSTLLKLLHRQYQPGQGEIYFHDKPIRQHHYHQFSRQVAVLNQNVADSLFTSLTVYENYLLMNQQHTLRSRHQEGKTFLQNYLQDFNPNLSGKVDLTINQLSGGEKQALALALCLLEPPSLLLLDEHTSALDPKTSEQIMQLTQKMITQHNMTCILTTHDLDIALRYGNRILMLNDGSILNMFDKDEKGRLSKDKLVRCYYA